MKVKVYVGMEGSQPATRKSVRSARIMIGTFFMMADPRMSFMRRLLEVKCGVGSIAKIPDKQDGRVVF